MKIIKENELNIAVTSLKNGRLVSFPTETVFGIGVIYDNKKAYEKLISVKRRPPEKPFTLMCADIEDIEKYACVDSRANRLIEKFMPGQFTIILKAKKSLPSYVVSKEGNVGIRISSSELIRKLIREVGKPLLVPSANRSNMPPLTNSDDVVKEFKDDIDAVIEGKSVSNVPSTIVLVDENITIIREGIITKEDVINALKEN